MNHLDRIIECVPNFSEGRDQHVINQIADAIRSVEGVKLLNVDPGQAANRTVMTFIGQPELVVEAAFRAARTTSELIDMRQHHGTHPRIGAIDVLPLVPISGIALEECAELARTLARRMADELLIPCYLYEAAALKASHRNLAVCRAGEYEGLSAKLLDPETCPDIVPDRINEKAGASVVGARDFLIAVNFNLNTKSVPVAHDIACAIRERGRGGVPGTLKCVKAIGWYIEEYDIAQVSVNLTNMNVTPLHLLHEEVCRQATARGVQVTGTEIIGLVPRRALLEAGRHFKETGYRWGGDKETEWGATDEELVRIAVEFMHLDDLRPFDIAGKTIS